MPNTGRSGGANTGFDVCANTERDEGANTGSDLCVNSGTATRADGDNRQSSFTTRCQLTSSEPYMHGK